MQCTKQEYRLWNVQERYSSHHRHCSHETEKAWRQNIWRLQIAAKILREFEKTGKGAGEGLEATEPLTEREIEVLELVVEGKSNQEIAERLVVSESTVKNHLRNILGKLHLRNRVQAAVFAVRQGLVENPPHR